MENKGRLWVLAKPYSVCISRRSKLEGLRLGDLATEKLPSYAF